MQSVLTIKKHLTFERGRHYYDIPFQVDENVERLDFEVKYQRKVTSQQDIFTFEHDVNVLDFSICDEQNRHIGSAAAVRTKIFVSGTDSSDGFEVLPIHAGTWHIVAGTYATAQQGVDVEYIVTTTYKTRRIFAGDLHVHSLDSDGKLDAQLIDEYAKTSGFDYITHSEHHNYYRNFITPRTKGITVLPGMEWTTYFGHCGMLGVKKPYEGEYCANSHEEVLAMLKKARDNGAVIILNHPFDTNCDLTWAFDTDAFDCVEIWNGRIVPEHVAWWHGQLCAGRKINVTGGSDFHRFDMSRAIARPCTCLAAMSAEADDLVDAVKHGRAFMTYWYDGPKMTADCEGKTFGETAKKNSPVRFGFTGLNSGDIICIISDRGEERVECPRHSGRASASFERTFGDASFVRVEILRNYLGIEQNIALLSNPIYFK